MMRLSSRLPEGLDAADLVEAALPSDIWDLTVSNPTRVALPLGKFGPTHLKLAETYQPEPLGPKGARREVARLLGGWGRPAASDDVALCAGTSEALSYLFKAFLAPGERVVVAHPGYPLMAHLAELEGLSVVPCPSDLHGSRWQLDMGAMASALASGAKMVVLVSPNNPTGARLSDDALDQLAKLCRRYEALFVLDEVFACYGARPPVTELARLDGFDLAFSLGGLSKAGLWPQLKLGWIQVCGQERAKRQAQAALEWVSDAYLSLSQPVVDALPELLMALPSRQAAMQARLTQNRLYLAKVVAGTALRFLPHEAGWYAMVDVGAEHPRCLEATRRGRTLARHLEEEARVKTLPADLFDLSRPSVLITSLIVAPQHFAAGWHTLMRYLAAT